jgi:hypothetical protein
LLTSLDFDLDREAPAARLFLSLPTTASLFLMYFCYLRYGFGAYFNLLPGSEWSALMLTYGFPLTIIGMALKARTLLD